jgi:ribosomal protein L11 methyltransferase
VTEAPVSSYPVLELDGPEDDRERALALVLDFGCLGAIEIASDRIRAFFPEGSRLDDLVREIETSLPRLACRIAAPEPERDWLSSFRATLVGFGLGASFFVVPSWRPLPSIDRSILRIDPERAFGTGSHDTTRLAATLLERFVRPGARVIDLGSGTGILAMVAARLGAVSVTALDPDEEAYRCAIENVERNDLSRIVRVECRGYQDFDALEADLIVANVNRPVLSAAIERLDATTILLSGLLAEELDDFSRSLPGRLAARESWTAGDWGALVLGTR